MAAYAYKTGPAVSKNAKKRLANLHAYPTLETFQNPVTRGIARRLANDAFRKCLDEIDFEYRLSDVEFGDVACVKYETRSSKPGDTVILFVHGGGFVTGSPHANAAMILPTAELSGVEAYGVQYPLLPEGRFPAPIDAVDRLYKALIAEDPDRKIALFADSTGCAIALCAILRWREEGIASPAGVVLISPVIDGKGASDTHITLNSVDPLYNADNGKAWRKLFEFYAPGEDLSSPQVSPIYSDFKWAPPMLVHAGTREVCLGDAARLSEKAWTSGGDVTLRVFDGMYHLFQMHWSLDEAKRAHQDIANFVTRVRG